MRASRRITSTAALIAVGAVARVALGDLALSVPVPVYGILIKVGLTETLTFVDGFVFGPLAGFLTGALIIIISDMFMLPGAWTPFIAAIIGILGIGAGLIRRIVGNPSVKTMGASAVVLTFMSEFLQNTWVAVFYNIPIVAAMGSGLASLVTALANNIVLFTTVGLRIIKLLRETSLRSN